MFTIDPCGLSKKGFIVKMLEALLLIVIFSQVVSKIYQDLIGKTRKNPFLDLNLTLIVIKLVKNKILFLFLKQ
jgi:hypothetical protein